MGLQIQDEAFGLEPPRHVDGHEGDRRPSFHGCFHCDPLRPASKPACDGSNHLARIHDLGTRARPAYTPGHVRNNCQRENDESQGTDAAQAGSVAPLPGDRGSLTPLV